MHSSHPPIRSVRPTLLLALAAGALGTDASAQQLFHAYDKPVVPGDSSSFTRIANVGDVDGDGKDDLLLGDPAFSTGSLAAAGRIEVISGATGAILFSRNGTKAQELFGRWVGRAGDWDHDSRADLLVSWVNNGTKVISVISAASGVYIRTFGQGTTVLQFGDRATSGFDVNADGTPDLITSSQAGSNGGWVYLYSGATGGLLWSALSPDLGVGDLPSDSVRIHPLPIADLDNDGILDFAAAAPLAPGNGGSSFGRVRILSGIDADVVLDVFAPAPSGVSYYGIGFANVGDLDTDGFDDLAVGYHEGGAGAVEVVSSVSGARLFHFPGQPSAVGPGPDTGDLFGHSVAGVPDVDGDGFGEILIGAKLAHMVFNLIGGSFLYSGRTGSLISAILPPTGGGAGPKSGAAIAGLKDVDGDGLGDLAIVCPEFAKPGFYGRVEIYSGTPDAVTAFGSGCPGTGGFVPELSGTIVGPGLRLDVVKGFGGTPGLLLIGILPEAFGSLPPTLCRLLVEPLAFTVPIALSGSGAGNGTWSQLVAPLTFQATFSLQALVHAPIGVPGQFAGTNGLQISIH